VAAGIGDIILEVNGIAVQKDDGAFDRIYGVASNLKEGEKLTSKGLCDGKVIELRTTITR
jgi:S1-C subfamily serine protease